MKFQSTTNQAFDLINKIALNAEHKCKEPIPQIIRDALEEISSLAHYKGVHGNPISDERRNLFELDN